MKARLYALLVALALVAPATSFASVHVSVSIAPPPLLVYEQPAVPGPDYVWMPGYWDWDEEYEDYYWVPGTWVLAPRPNYYWTPGYWAWIDSFFVWHGGYWGPHVGYYGGINYGYGYGGHGYDGGRWERDHFHYNTAVNNVNVTRIHNTYNTTVINNYNVQRVSYNGGHGGVNARPRADEERAAREHHIERTDWQERHQRAARSNREQFASRREGGREVIAATPKPAEFKERNVVRAAKPEWQRDRAVERGADRGNDTGRNERADRDRKDDNDRNERRERADRGRDREVSAAVPDLDNPLRNERPQSRRHKERSTPVKPDASPRPEIAPRERPSRDSEPVERPRRERLPPIERDSPTPRAEPIERPQRPDRMGRPERMDRPERMERVERPQRPERAEAMPRVESAPRPHPDQPRAPRGLDKPDKRESGGQGHGRFRS